MLAQSVECCGHNILLWLARSFTVGFLNAFGELHLFAIDSQLNETTVLYLSKSPYIYRNIVGRAIHMRLSQYRLGVYAVFNVVRQIRESPKQISKVMENCSFWPAQGFYQGAVYDTRGKQHTQVSCMTCTATRELTVYNDRSRRSTPWIITCQRFFSISFLRFFFLVYRCGILQRARLYRAAENVIQLPRKVNAVSSDFFLVED